MRGHSTSVLINPTRGRIYKCTWTEFRPTALSSCSTTDTSPSVDASPRQEFCDMMEELLLQSKRPHGSSRLESSWTVCLSAPLRGKRMVVSGGEAGASPCFAKGSCCSEGVRISTCLHGGVLQRGNLSHYFHVIHPDSPYEMVSHFFLHSENLTFV